MSMRKEIYRVYYKLYPKGENFDSAENEEDFGVITLKVRNDNNHSYRFYHEETNESITIEKKMLGGVFITFGLTEEVPYVMSSFIVDDQEMYELISGKVPAKDEEEKKGLEDLKKGLSDVVKSSLERYIDNLKMKTEKLLRQPKEHTCGDPDCKCETSEEVCNCSNE